MRFLIDAQLPRRLCNWLVEAGSDAIHTLDLPDGNEITDSEICRLARDEERIVVTKDSDFVQSHLLTSEPPRLLLIATGNISNRKLIGLFERNLASLVDALETASFVELQMESIVEHY